MPIKPENSPRRVVLSVLVLVAVVAGVALSYLQTMAVTAQNGAEQARKRLDDDIALATRYKSMSTEMLEVSDDVTAARSSGFLQEALRRNGIASPGISSDEPRQVSDNIARIDTTVTFGYSSLSAVVGFLREVETGRSNLSLVEVTLDRDGSADRWDSPGIKYAALVRTSQ